MMGSSIHKKKHRMLSSYSGSFSLRFLSPINLNLEIGLDLDLDLAGRVVLQNGHGDMMPLISPTMIDIRL